MLNKQWFGLLSFAKKKNIFYILNKSWNGDEQQITEYVYYLITTITYNDIFLIFNPH